jgi:hypothetical protein
MGNAPGEDGHDIDVHLRMLLLFLSGLIRLVEKHHAQMIYTRATKAGTDE